MQIKECKKNLNFIIFVRLRREHRIENREIAMKSTNIPRLLGKLINAIVYISPKLGARMALNLFRYPLAGRIKNKHAKFLNNAKKHTLHFNKTKIQTYRWKGEGETILLMHGWQSNSSRWRSLIPKLQANNYNIISMDAPAHGNSGGVFFDAYQYALFLDKVVKHFEPKIIVAHSIGGLTALYYKSHFKSDGIAKIISLGAPNKLVDLTAFFTKLLGFSERTIKAYNREFINFFEKDQTYYNTEDFVKKITIKGLVIHDKNDQLNSYKDGVSIAENWEGAELYTTQRLGHALQSKEVYDVILSELNK